MSQKIIMHDQVFNKVEDIMNHYKRKPMEGLMRLLKQFMKQSSVIWGCMYSGRRHSKWHTMSRWKFDSADKSRETLEPFVD